MFANIIKFDNEKSIILLENNVKISRNDETIYGDSGIFDIKNNSYKIKSNNSNPEIIPPPGEEKTISISHLSSSLDHSVNLAMHLLTELLLTSPSNL